MKNMYKTIALSCAGLTFILMLASVIAWFAGGKLFDHWWISYLNLSHYLMLFGILLLLLMFADREKKE